MGKMLKLEDLGEISDSDEEWSLQRAKQLAMRGRLTPFSLEELEASIPKDWRPGEADVDEFLASIRSDEGKR